MSPTLCNLLFFVFISICGSKSKTIEWGQTRFVSVLFRHGARTPYAFYPSDPYKNLTYWPEGLGHLTNVGKQQSFELGQWLRKRYDALLTERYSHDLIYARSTDVDRTLMSAQCVLAGMYPPRGAQVWNDHLEWQPIPVHTVPRKLDNSAGREVNPKPPVLEFGRDDVTRSLQPSKDKDTANQEQVYTGSAPCLAYKEEYKEVFKSKEVEALKEKYAEVIKVLNENTGEENSLHTLYEVHSNLFIEQHRNLTLPDWTKSIFPHPIAEAVGQVFGLHSRTKKLARLKAGLIIKTIVDDMMTKRRGGSRNVHVYSGHDGTLASVLTALGVFYPHNPPFAACLMVELREMLAGHHVVMIFYRTSTLEEPSLLTIPGCTAACPLDQFISINKPLAISPEEWIKEC